MNLSKSVIERLSIILIALICILFGSINNMDLGISTLLYHPNSVIGRIFENHILLVVFLPIIYIALVLWKNTSNQLQRTLYGLLAIGVSVYAGHANVRGYTTGMLHLLFAVILGVIFFLALFLFVSTNKKVVTQDLMLYKKIIVTFIVIVFVVHSIKFLDGRMRFRDFTDRLYYSQYTNWFQFKLLGKGNSFPSGHTSTFYVLIPILTMFKLEKTKVRYVAYGFVFVMAFYRIVMGAHFLTDTMVAVVIAVSCDMLISKFGGRYFEQSTTSV